jgi:hypothetical protein
MITTKIVSGISCEFESEKNKEKYQDISCPEKI